LLFRLRSDAAPAICQEERVREQLVVVTQGGEIGTQVAP
jgi:hypothetical protein